MKRLSITVVTTSRADYGLLFPLLKKMVGDGYFDVKIIATGSHLSKHFGNTINQITSDGFDIADAIDIISDGDMEEDICYSISKGINGFSNAIIKNQPDLILMLGDRYELWTACIPAVIHKVPVAHIHGGEATLGLIDDAVRHSVSKMASIHFPSIDIYGKRIIQMGENPEHIFVVGALGIDNINNIQLMSSQELSAFSGVDFNKDICLMTYHPVTLDEYNSARHQTIQVLEALVETELMILSTMPNADTGGNAVYNVIKEYAEKFPQRIKLVKNLGQKAYLSAMRYAKIMVGNSSSGIIESASFGLPTVNIGDRQSGRFKPTNVIDCECSKKEIIKAVNTALSTEFIKSIKSINNPYGDGSTADRIIDVLKKLDFTNKATFIKKGFYDIKF